MPSSRRRVGGRDALRLEPLRARARSGRGSSGCRRGAGSCATADRRCGRASARRRAGRRRRRAAPQASVRFHGGDVRARRDERVDVRLGHLVARSPRSRACRPRPRARRGRRRRARRARGTPRARPSRRGSLNCSASQRVDRPRRHVPDRTSPRFGDRLRERRVLLQLAADERERRPGRRRLEVGGDRLRVRRPSTPRRSRRTTSRRPRRRGRARCRRRPRRRRVAVGRVVQLDRVGVERGRAAARPRGRPSAGRCPRSGTPA